MLGKQFDEPICLPKIDTPNILPGVFQGTRFFFLGVPPTTSPVVAFKRDKNTNNTGEATIQEKMITKKNVNGIPFLLTKLLESNESWKETNSYKTGNFPLLSSSLGHDLFSVRETKRIRKKTT